jgi:ankyrin repeat protein
MNKNENKEAEEILEEIKTSNPSLEKIENFLKNGFNSNHTYPKENKRGLIHIASSIGNKEIVSLLIKYKANINLEDRISSTPLHISCIFHLLILKVIT